MWDQRSFITISISIFFIIDSSLACIKSYTYPRYFTFNQPCYEPRPAVITQELVTPRLKHDEVIPRLNVTVTGVREAFNLTLLAIPQVKSVPTIQGFPMNKTADCPRRINETMDVHQYLDTCVMTTDEGNGKQVKTFDHIFSGCYYVLMTNSKQESWQSEPKFHSTPYHYRNTKIEHDVPRISPTNDNGNLQLEMTVSIPLSCLVVTARIFELNRTWVENDSEIIHQDIFQQKIKASEECIVSQNGARRPCFRSDITKNLSFEVSKQGSSGEVLLKWSSLTRGGGVYYLRLGTHVWNCFGDDYSNYTYYLTWVPLIRDIFLTLGVRNESVEADNNVNYMGAVSLGLVLILSIALAAVFAYFLNKYYRFRKALREKEKIEESLPYAQVFNEKELKQILLIYARGSPQFMTEMRNFRYRLGAECNCRVHDVYSSEDFFDIEKLGAHEWATRLLIVGSKVVWVDTPQLRSYFNDKQMQNASTDCRDAAIPFAIEWATSLFQNPTTQYRCNFVVRVKGFEVEDGRDDDPLRVVSPHARYYIPGNFVRLCGDITTSVTPKYKPNPEV